MKRDLSIKTEIKYWIDGLNDDDEIKVAFMLLNKKQQNEIIDLIFQKIIDDLEVWEVINKNIDYYFRHIIIEKKGGKKL